MVTPTLCAALALLLSGQDPVRIELEDLAGKVRERPASEQPLTDLEGEGASFARFVGAPEPKAPPGPLDARLVATLHTGDRVWASVQGGDGETLALVLHDAAPLALSLESLSSLLFPRRLPNDGTFDPEPAEEGDRLYLQRGRGLDKLDGLVHGFRAEGVSFEGRFGQRTYAWGEIAALFVEDLGGDEEPVESPALVDLPDGGRLSGRLVAMDASGVTLDRRGDEVHLPASIVREVALDDGSFRFLSQLPVDDGGPVTLFGGGDDLGMVYPHRIDRNCLNGPLRSGGRTWSRGIGVHAPSRLTWHLGGEWGTLRIAAAIDDSVLRSEFHGSVVFRVLVDGELRFESGVVEGGDAPLELPAIDLAGADELVLVVDPAADAFVCDRANWLRPLLVR